MRRTSACGPGSHLSARPPGNVSGVAGHVVGQGDGHRGAARLVDFSSIGPV
jgi:hypothetical protein